MTYSAVFKEHLAHPHNAGELPGATVVVEETNPVCGDRLRLYLLVEDDQIETAKYLAYGCPPTLVCGSVLTDLVRGKKIQEALAITKDVLIAAAGGLPGRKHHSAALALETLRSALTQLGTSTEEKSLNLT
ncbi:MAG: iron-sulfur cluster assembly scaffold protein [Blastocatellia bacterium]|nr:MAG: iron-sulfur cluster assembly scaffold protein [Blastocatellia bacterium]